MLNIASVPLPAWQAVFLIILSFGSLVIALYCLLFMVPLKKFVHRIESLGGGMEGIKKHLNGVEDYFKKELDRIHTSHEESLDEVKRNADKRIKEAEQRSEEVIESLQRVESQTEDFSRSLDEFKSGLEAGCRKTEKLETIIEELKRDMAVLGEETEGKLQKRVRESYYELEANVLATLEVLRDELLPPAEPSGSGPGKSDAPGKGASEDRKIYREDTEQGESKIISAGPLFSRSSHDNGGNNEDEDGGGDVGEGEGDDSKQ